MSKKPTYQLPWIIKDTREQKGFNFRASANCAGMIEDKLDYGDYALKDHLDLITIERKQNVTELCGNLGKNRDRFERELERMQSTRFRYVVVEDYWSSIKKPKYSRMNPEAVFQSIIALEIKYGVHFIFAGTHEMAQKITRSLLLKAYKYKLEGRFDDPASNQS